MITCTTENGDYLLNSRPLLREVCPPPTSVIHPCETPPTPCKATTRERAHMTRHRHISRGTGKEIYTGDSHNLGEGESFLGWVLTQYYLYALAYNSLSAVSSGQTERFRSWMSRILYPRIRTCLCQ